MSGKALEEEEKANDKSGESPKMDKLIETLEGMTTRLTTMPDVPAHIRQMLAQALELRKSGWGNGTATTGSSSSSSGQNQQPQYPQQPPQPLTAEAGAPNTELTPEEIAFMAEHLGGDFGPDDDDDDEDDLPPEIAAAYEEFLADQEKEKNK